MVVFVCVKKKCVKKNILLSLAVLYTISFVTGDQIQIQFNDVAKNIPNAEILKFDGVATGGFKFEYDKTLELTNKTTFEFKDPSSNTFYIAKDKVVQGQISKLGLNNGDSITFSGQVTNSNSTINITAKEEYTITKIDKITKQDQNSTIQQSSLSSNQFNSTISSTQSTKKFSDQSLTGLNIVRTSKTIIQQTS
jgi:hypothetical protein